MSKDRPTPESAEVVQIRQDYDRELYRLRRELSYVHGKLIDADRTIAGQLIYREAGQMLVGIIDRYHRAMRSIGWTPPDDELAIVEKIRQDLEQ